MNMSRPLGTADTIHVGKLTKGIRLDTRSTEIPDGGFLSLTGYTVQPQGPTRAEGFLDYTLSDTGYIPSDLITAWNDTGEQKMLLLTDRNLYLLVPGGGVTEVPWAYDTGTAVLAGLTVTGTGTAWTTNDIMTGDLFESEGQRARIASVDSATQLTLESAIVMAVDESYLIQRSFGNGETIFHDWVTFNNYLLIADGHRPLIAYDLSAGTLGYWVNDGAYYIATGITFAAATVTYFQDRVWAAYTVDSVDGIQRQRIRWSALANTRDFSFTQNYLDLPYVGGALIKLTPLNNVLIAYFEDAVFVGVPTNNPDLPLRWERLETGGIGLVNNKSMTPFIGGHFWIGSDNFYFTDGQTVETLGDPVLPETFDLTTDFSMVRIAMDIRQKSVAFGIPASSGSFREIWFFNYTTRAWSKRGASGGTALSSPVVDDPVTWDTLPLAATWDTLNAYYQTWNLIGRISTDRYFYLGAANRFWLSDADTDLEFITDTMPGTPLTAVAITPDHAFGDEDWMKVAVRFSLKIRRPLGRTARALQFLLTASTDQGNTFKNLGTLSFAATQTEAYVTFRLLGATMRFMLEAYASEPTGDLSVVGAHILSGYSLRIAGSGAELSLKN